MKHLPTFDADIKLVVSHGAFGRALRHAVDSDIPFYGSDVFKNAKIVRLL